MVPRKTPCIAAVLFISVLFFSGCKIVNYPYYISDDIFAIDLVFCIDISGSMGSQLDQVKDNIISLYEELESMMESDEKYITALRARIILFSDIYVDGENALQQTRFYDLPDDGDALAEYVQQITLLNGGDEAESGLEALAMAMQSDWGEGDINKRDVICLWSDAPAIDLMPDSWPDTVPSGLYTSFDEMTEAWNGGEMNPAGKRLILFTPERIPWTTIADDWEDSHFYPVWGAGTGFDTVLDTIVGDL